MADGDEIKRHYDVWGTLHQLRMSDYPDYSCAFFNGNYRQTLEEAQNAKHKWIFDNLGLGVNLTDKEILDIGCGWGPMLNAARIRGGLAVGITLSPGQAKYCWRRGLQVILGDYKEVNLVHLGTFSGVVSLGAFEHFCSVEDYLAGKQEEVYREFFRFCADALNPEGMLYLQTMTWGKKVPDYHSASLGAHPDSTEAILKRLSYFYPGSWLPSNLEQIVECASPYFNLVLSNNGRLDYLETLKRWGAATPNLFKARTLPKTIRHGLPIIFRYLTDKGTRIQWESLQRHDQGTAFRREIMNHWRIFFQKK